jgi:hypothetical protein
MDESVINGANLFFAPQFGIEPRGGTPQENSRNQWLLGLVNSAPYVSFISPELIDCHTQWNLSCAALCSAAG